MSTDEAVAEDTKQGEEDLPFSEVQSKEGESGDAQASVAQLVSRIEGQEREPDEIEADIRQIEALSGLDPSIREMPEYKNLMETVGKVKAKTENTEEDEDEEEEKGKEEKKEGAVTQQAEEEEEIEDDEDDVFGLNKSKKPKRAPIDLEVDEKFEKFIEKNYAIKDADTFFNSVDNWRKDAQKAAEVSRDLQDMNEGIQSLPQEIKDSIAAYASGEDYYSAFTKAGERINFGRDFKEQEKESVVRHYYTKKLEKLEERFDDGQIDEDEFDERIEDLHDAAKRLYERDKKEYEKQRAELIASEERNLESFKNSAVSSVDSLKSQFPDFSKKNLQRVHQRLVNGRIEDLFYDKNGNYKPEAAKMVAYAEFGDSLVEKRIGRAKIEGESKANEEIVLRGDKKPKKSKKSQTQQKQKEAVDAISHLQSSFNKDPYS